MKEKVKEGKASVYEKTVIREIKEGLRNKNDFPLAAFLD